MFNQHQHLPEITESSFVYVVLMEDAPVHTLENNYVCGEPDCPCAEAQAQALEQDNTEAYLARKAAREPRK